MTPRIVDDEGIDVVQRTLNLQAWAVGASDDLAAQPSVTFVALVAF